MKEDVNQKIQYAIDALKENNFEIAVDLLKKVIQSQSAYSLTIQRLSSIYNNLGIALMQLENLNEAKENFKKAFEINPLLAEAHNNLGILLQKSNRISESIKSFKKALEIKHNYFEAYKNLGISLYKIDKVDEAVVAYLKAIELKPDSIEANYNLGSIFFELNKFDEAELIFKKIIKLKPHIVQTYNILGSLLDNAGRLDEAEEVFKKILEIEPNNLDALFNKGLILLKKKKFELALKDFDSSNNINSRSKSLECLYALNKTEEIYQRIETNNKLDENNLSIAAFASFISAKEKKITANRFCINPLEFIQFSNLSTHLKDSELFVNELINELSKIKTRWEPMEKTTINGFQSEIGINLFQDPPEKMNILKSIILNEIDSYYSKFKNETCVFIQKWPKNKNLWSWYINLKKQGYQKTHIHPTGWLSGVIYLKVVPPLKQNEGAIEFSLNGDYYYDKNLPSITHKPNIGDIVLFPSSLHHRTIPFSTDTNRIIVSFDLLPNE